MTTKLTKLIGQRRSVRTYTGEAALISELETIQSFCANATPLFPHIRVRTEIVTKEQVRFYLPWKTPQLLAIYSENKPGYLENVGFLFQQVDLFLQSMGLGSCWLGLGKLRDIGLEIEGMEFVILMAFGHTSEPLRTDVRQFQRKSLPEIADIPDDRLEPARLAPSSTNSQPWFFTHQDEKIHVYKNESGLIRHKMLGRMNQIDIGIALAHLYVSNPAAFRFFQTQAPELKNHRYFGTVTL